MAVSRYTNFFERVFNKEFSKEQPGFRREDAKDILTFNDDIVYEIPKSREFRPDLIAYYFYGNPRLCWVLTYVNQINNSPEGFHTGRKIRIPKIEKVNEVV